MFKPLDKIDQANCGPTHCSRSGSGRSGSGQSDRDLLLPPADLAADIAAERRPDLRITVRPHFMTDGFDPRQPDYYWDFKIAFTSYWHEPITVTKRSMKPLASSVDWRNTPSHWDFWQAVIVAPGQHLEVSHLVKLHCDAAIIQGTLHCHTPGGAPFLQTIPPFSCDCPYSQRNYQ